LAPGFGHTLGEAESCVLCPAGLTAEDPDRALLVRTEGLTGRERLLFGGIGDGHVTTM
jgi:hypothetical protein